jgi:hypothetical protein
VGAEVGDGVEDEIDVGRGAGVVTGLRAGICDGDGVCASGGVVQVGFPSWGAQVREVNLRCSKSGCCGFLGFHSLME